MNDLSFFFDGWDPVGRVLVVGSVMYVVLLALLRISGTRTLANMKAFDFVITVVIGAAFGRALTATEVALAEVVAAFVLLVALQYMVAWLQAESAFFRNLITTPPVLLYFRGELVLRAMKRHGITETELKEVVRRKSIGSMSEVDAIILEPSGDFSVIEALGDGSALSSEVQEQQPRRSSSSES